MLQACLPTPPRRLHSLFVKCVSCDASCTFPSLQRLARAPAPLRHLVIGPGIKLSAAVVVALAMLRTRYSLKLDKWTLARSSDDGAIRWVAAESERGSAEVAVVPFTSPHRRGILYVTLHQPAAIVTRAPSA